MVLDPEGESVYDREHSEHSLVGVLGLAAPERQVPAGI